MGLIKAASESVSKILGDQWREYFYYDAISEDVLMVKGKKRIGSNSACNRTKRMTTCCPDQPLTFRK